MTADTPARAPTNPEILAVLAELADLLEIAGANPFRIRAYRNAVRSLETVTRSLSEMVEKEEDLQQFPGVGKDIAAAIEELVRTGGLETLEELGTEIPRELVTLTAIDGVGPKRARAIWDALRICTPDDLEQAIEGGQVETLSGFGTRTCEKILRGIADWRLHQERVLLVEADRLVRPLLGWLEEAPGVERAEAAGSYRRRKETVGDLDLLALTDGDPAPVMERFTSYPAVERVEMAGDTRSSVVLRSGLAVDLRVLPSVSWGAALHYFTGSKEHNVAVRKRGRERGLRVSEYGVFRVGERAEEAGGGGAEEAGEGERVAGATEEDVFRAVDLPWIDPVLREDRGEIAAADADRLPRLVTTGDIRGDLQMHSTWSDGKSSIREMAEAARERGYEYLSITDHSRAVTVANGLQPERVEEQWLEIERVRDELTGIHLFRSLEIDILRDGSLDMPDRILEGLDVVLVSVHSHMNLPRAEMTERVVRALRHPRVDILAHPTGRLLNRRQPYDIDVETVLETAREKGVAVELNANPHRLDLDDAHVRRAKELGVKVVISTDAHSIPGMDVMSYGVDQARRGWLEPDDVLNCLPLEEFRAWVERPRTS